ncbi:MAG: ECF transporter S component [Peptococcaceae bacterium]|jgi:riboflavin transporter FmnP|nr:ECF transporter S component [Peptococcaceae bacterium]
MSVSRSRRQTRILVHSAMWVALSVVLIMLVQVPLFAAAPWMKYDMADVPVIIASLYLGPVSGLMILAAVSLIQAMYFGGDGMVGFLMHFIASGSLVFLTSVIYQKKQTLLGLVMGLAVGACTMVAMMIPMNFIFTVHFFGVPQEMVKEMMLPVIIPFNAIKAGLNAVISFAVYQMLIKRNAFFDFTEE